MERNQKIKKFLVAFFIGTALRVASSFTLCALSLCLWTAPLPTAEAASGVVWSGSGEPFDMSVPGDKEHPYIIDTAEKLAYLAQQVNAGDSYRGKHFKLTTDLDLNGKPWTPIGVFGKVNPEGVYNFLVFRGDFDGNGHTISNLKIEKNSIADFDKKEGMDAFCVGLFGVVDGVVERVRLSGADVKGHLSVGALAGVVAANGKIMDCSASGTVKGASNVGGLVGVLNKGGAVTGSEARVRVDGNKVVGGLVGLNQGSLVNSKAGGNVTGTNDMVGGLVGFNQGELKEVAASGNVTGEQAVGGLVGITQGSLVNAKAAGNVTGSKTVGGLVGVFQQGGTLTDGAASGNVSGKEYVGGLTGWIQETAIVSNGEGTGNVSGEKHFGQFAGLDQSDKKTLPTKDAAKASAEPVPVTTKNLDPAVIALDIITDLRTMKAASLVFYVDSMDEVDSGGVKLEVKYLTPYVDDPGKYSETPGRYLFEEDADKNWWVGYNLAAGNIEPAAREALKEKTQSAGLYGAENFNAPYNGEDVVFMVARGGVAKPTAKAEPAPAPAKSVNPVVTASDIITDLRTMKAASLMFYADSMDELNNGVTKLEVKYLTPYVDDPGKFSETPGEYIFEEGADKNWWVGYNLTVDNIEPAAREALKEKTQSAGLYGAEDLNAPYSEENIVFMIARSNVVKPTAKATSDAGSDKPTPTMSTGNVQNDSTERQKYIHIEVKGKKVNLRNAPGTNSRVLKQVNEGDYYVVALREPIKAGRTWFKCLQGWQRDPTNKSIARMDLPSQYGAEAFYISYDFTGKAYYLTDTEWATLKNSEQKSKIAAASKTGAADTPASAKSASAKTGAPPMEDGRFIALCREGALQEIEAAIAGGANVNAQSYNGTALMEAARYNNPDAVLALIKAGADVNTRINNQTALSWAGDYDEYSKPVKTEEDIKIMLTALIKAGADMDVRVGFNEETVLARAVSDSVRGDRRKSAINVKVVSILLEAGADVDTRNKDGDTLLMIAAEYEFAPEKVLRMITLLLDAGANPDLRNSKGLRAVDLMAEGTEAFKKLRAATKKDFVDICFDGTTQEIEAAIAAGADIGTRGKDGRTALMAAAANSKNPEAVSILLKAGAEVNAQSDSGWTALMFATWQGSPEIVSTLLKAGAEVNAQSENGWTPLLAAAANSKSPEVLAILLDTGADIKTKSKNGRSVLSFAGENKALKGTDVYARLFELIPMDDVDFVNLCAKGSRQEIEAAIAAGANVNARGKKDVSALLMAIQSGNIEAIDTLLKARATPNARDSGDYIPLTAAIIENKDIKIVEMLLKAGANPSPESWNSKNEALIAAAMRGNTKAITLLVQAGANIDEGLNGWTPLIQAADSGKAEAVNLLLNLGADPNKKFIDGRRAIDFAESNRVLTNTKALIKLRAATGKPPKKASSTGITIKDFFQTFRAVAERYGKKIGSAVEQAVKKTPAPKQSSGAAMSVDDFFDLCATGTPQQIEAAIAAGADVKSILQRQNEPEGLTTLMWAANKNRDPDVIRTLIKMGVDVNAKSGEGVNALVYAVIGTQNPEVIKALIESGADLKIHDDWDVLGLVAVRPTTPGVVRELIKGGANVNIRYKDYGMTPLMLAALNSESVDVLQELIEGGADITATDDSGDTASDLLFQNKNGLGWNVDVQRLLDEKIEARPNPKLDDFAREIMRLVLRIAPGTPSEVVEEALGRPVEKNPVGYIYKFKNVDILANLENEVRSISCIIPPALFDNNARAMFDSLKYVSRELTFKGSQERSEAAPGLLKIIMKNQAGKEYYLDIDARMQFAKGAALNMYYVQ
jgi:ankyrin repeat protein